MSAAKTESRQARIDKLIEAYRYARDEQRTATESPMVESDQPGDRMQEIADQLAEFGIDVTKIDDHGASTL